MCVQVWLELYIVWNKTQLSKKKWLCAILCLSSFGSHLYQSYLRTDLLVYITGLVWYSPTSIYTVCICNIIPNEVTKYHCLLCFKMILCWGEKRYIMLQHINSVSDGKTMMEKLWRKIKQMERKKNMTRSNVK